MMRQRVSLIAAVLVAAMLAAGCGESVQTRRVDEQAWKGVNNAYVAPGWNQGDHASWEAQLRTRAQAQNEYGKVR